MISPMDYSLINLLSLRSDQHLVSPYNITPNHTLRSQELRKLSLIINYYYYYYLLLLLLLIIIIIINYYYYYYY